MKYLTLEKLANNISSIRDLLGLAQIDGYKENKKYSSKKNQHDLEKKVFEEIIECFEKKDKNLNDEQLNYLQTSGRIEIVKELISLLIDIREKKNQKSGSGFYKYYGKGKSLYELITKKFNHSSALYGEGKHNAIYKLLDSLLSKGHKRKKYEDCYLEDINEDDDNTHKKNKIDKRNSALENAFKEYVKENFT